MKAIVREHWSIIAIAAIFAALATIYSLVTPIFEASDEISHYPVIEHIATTGSLPVQRPGVETLWEQEGSQPPLYYMLGAALTFWVDTSDLEDILWRNPHAKLGIPLDPDNRNMVIHTEAEAFPWHGTVLAAHLIRFFSIALGTGSIVLIYFIALETMPDSYWIAGLSAALAAFNPMFLFISGSVNNDNLTVLLSSAIILICAKILRTGLTSRRIAALAILSGLAILTKISGLTLLPIVGGTLLAHAILRRDWRNAVIAGLAVAAGCITLAGWWYIRNLMLYGELLGLETHVAIAGGRSIGLIELVRNEWYGFWVSYWALFGAVNILAAPPVYTFYAVISVAAILGLVVLLVRWVRAKEWHALLVPGLLMTQIVVVLGGVIRWTMTTYASQGRLIFPAIGALSTLTAIGLLGLISQRARFGVMFSIAVPMFLIAAAAPFTYIPPAYALPPTIAHLPDDAIPVAAQFDQLSLVGVEVSPVTTSEGGRVPITLYWQLRSPIKENYSIYLHALGRENEEIGKIDSYPGAGTLPTSRMQPDTIYVDTYSIELDPDFDAPTAVRILIGAALYQDETFASIDPTHPDGSAREAVVVTAAVAYPRSASACISLAETPPIASFGGFALLWTGDNEWNASAGDTIPIDLLWDRFGSTDIDWTVFIHLLDSSGKLVSQADSPPIDGFYPTSLWTQTCYITDTHHLQIPDDLPSGNYRVIVGMYDPTDPAFTRAVAADVSGQPYPEFAVPIGIVKVTE